MKNVLNHADLLFFCYNVDKHFYEVSHEIIAVIAALIMFDNHNCRLIITQHGRLIRDVIQNITDISVHDR